MVLPRPSDEDSDDHYLCYTNVLQHRDSVSATSCFSLFAAGCAQITYDEAYDCVLDACYVNRLPPRCAADCLKEIALCPGTSMG
eukprot:10586667-Heterocapsa_arctica.AAC.1